MGRAVALVMFSWLAFTFGQPKEGTISRQEAQFLGKWVGDPTSHLERQGWVVFFPGWIMTKHCLYGDAETSDFLNKAVNCLEEVDKDAKPISRLACPAQHYTHYGIANLRISHSNVIVYDGQVNRFGHFMIVYGDLFCARRAK